MFLSPIFQFCGVYLAKALFQVVIPLCSVKVFISALRYFCQPQCAFFIHYFILFAIHPLIPLSASLSDVFWAILFQADNITLKNNLISTDPSLWVQLLQFCGSFMGHAMCNYLLSDLQLSPGWFINVINLIHLSLDWIWLLACMCNASLFLLSSSMHYNF